LIAQVAGNFKKTLRAIRYANVYTAALYDVRKTAKNPNSVYVLPYFGVSDAGWSSKFAPL
jgi:hypothetical protein